MSQKRQKLGVEFEGATVNRVEAADYGLRKKFSDPQPSSGINFLVSFSGYVSPIPDGAVGPFTTRASGVEFRDGSGGHKFNTEDGGTRSFDSRTSIVRVMDANPNQGNRTVYENNAPRGPQVVDPFTGKTDLLGGHFYHDKKPT